MVISRAPIVLIADDESVVRDIARRILEDAGYRVLEASDGVEAVQVLKDGAQIDLLIADLKMPNLDGEEMVRQCRVLDPDLRVLYVSAVIDRLFDERPVLWEGEAYLQKPFSPVALIEAVNLLVYGHVNKPRT
jgi:two-component system, cell cycle sensor histidine kinase and response regulator CckA